MGGTTWSDDAYRTLRTDYSTKSKSAIFTSTGMSSDMSPHGVKYRESRDSDAHPETQAIALFLDVTGSMGDIPYHLIKEKLGALVNTLIAHGVKHPAILFGGIGDHITDKAPLQVGQFESGTEELNKWLTSTYLEGCGGGQDMESYLLAYLFCARHTSTDCFEKRNQKNFLFTIGDERSWDSLSPAKLKEIMGYSQSEELSLSQLLNEVKRTYHVFHIHINSTNYKDDPRVIGFWKDLLGERLLILDNYEATAELIASTVAMIRGADLKSITSGFDKDTATSVSNALAKVENSLQTNSKDGIVTI